MHTVIRELCTGCELCIPPCPVDCITLVVRDPAPDPTMLREEARQARMRYEMRLQRLARRRSGKASVGTPAERDAKAETIVRVMERARARLGARARSS
jgi:electron transport complex protein RnfB